MLDMEELEASAMAGEREGRERSKEAGTVQPSTDHIHMTLISMYN